MAKLFHTLLAKADLADIWSYIAADNPVAADKLLEQVDGAFTLIADTPELGFKIDDIKPGVRCKPVKRNYLIFYEFERDVVRVFRVLHAAREHEDLR